MDYYSDILINITDDELSWSTNQCPDRFRKSMFNLLNSIDFYEQHSNNPNYLAKITKTTGWEWNENKLEDIIFTICDIIPSDNKNNIIEYLNSTKWSNTTIYQYIYDLVDIYIVKNMFDEDKIFELLQILIKKQNMYSVNNNIILMRIIFYVYYHFYSLKISAQPKWKKHLEEIITKLEEFTADQNVKKYFSEEELTEYLKYFKKLSNNNS